MTAALERWSSSFADLPLFNEEKLSAGYKEPYDGNRFQIGMCYKVTVSRAVVAKSERNGDIQIEIDYDMPGFTTKRVWVTLPMQESDLPRDKDLVQWLTQMRMRDVERLYACALPSLYALYDERINTDEGPIWKGFDGKQMSDIAFNERRAQVQQNLKEIVERLHDKVGVPLREIEGTVLYMVLNNNPKNNKYPYVNISRTPMAGAPLYHVQEQYPDPEDPDVPNESAQVPF